jgi:glycosyltransferase involved in cell wall biosynthesis
MKKLKICYFGSFIADYPRNQVIIKGLQENSCELIFCNDRNRGFIHLYNLVKDFFIKGKNSEVIFVGVFGHYDVWIAWVLAKLFRKRLVFDSFISYYDTLVSDRKSFSKYSLTAFYTYLLDFLAVHLADKVLLDTSTHAKYFMDQFKLNPQKVYFVYIGADPDFFIPGSLKKSSKKLIVEFHGSFQPLQGVDYIVKAADILKEEKDIHFKIIGDGQTKKEVISLAESLRIKNIEFISRLSLSEIKKIINNSDICLGIFGSSQKANRVIPNKAYESLALKKPLITMDSQASREIFKSNVNCLLVTNDNPVGLAEAIVRLRNQKLRDKISLGGYKLFQENLTPKVIGKKLKGIILS